MLWMIGGIIVAVIIFCITCMFVNNEDLIWRMNKVRNNLYSVNNKLTSLKETLKSSITVNDSTFKSSEINTIDSKVENQIYVLNNTIIPKLKNSLVRFSIDSLNCDIIKIVRPSKIIDVTEKQIETITKNVDGTTINTTNKILQQGQNGLKEVTYKVKYQNEVEVEKTVISEIVIKQPVNKIVQVQKKVETSRSASLPRTSTAVVNGETYKITAYCSCSKCCGKATGRTASGTQATAGRTVAAPSKFAFGTKLNIGGQIYTVEDRGGAIKGNRIDIYVDSHSAALQWGVRYLPVSVVE